MQRNVPNLKSITPTSTASECSIPSEKEAPQRRPTPDIPRLNINNNGGQQPIPPPKKPNNSHPAINAELGLKDKIRFASKEKIKCKVRPKSNPTGLLTLTQTGPLYIEEVPKQIKIKKPQSLIQKEQLILGQNKSVEIKRNLYPPKDLTEPDKPTDSNQSPDKTNSVTKKPSEGVIVQDIIADSVVIIKPESSEGNPIQPNQTRNTSVVQGAEDIQDVASVISAPRHASYAVPNKTAMYLRHLKEKLGMNTNAAHVRHARDIPCTSKDLNLAIDATRVIEMTHLRMRQRFCRRAGSVDPRHSNSINESQRSESFAMNFDDKYLLNNPIFQTFWEKIFINKEQQVPSGKQSYIFRSNGDEERLRSKYCFSNGQGFFYGDPEDQDKYRDPVWMQAKTEIVRVVEPGNSPIIDFPVERCRLGTPVHFAKKKGKMSLNSSVRYQHNENFDLDQTKANTGFKGTNTKAAGGVKFNIFDDESPTKQNHSTSVKVPEGAQWNNIMSNYDYKREQYESKIKQELLRKMHCYQIKQPRFVRLESLLTENTTLDLKNSTIQDVKVF